MAGTRFYGGGRGVCYPSVVADLMEWSDPMTEFFDAHRPATAFDHDSTLVVAMELSGKSCSNSKSRHLPVVHGLCRLFTSSGGIVKVARDCRKTSHEGKIT